jgi:hypothetical protein
MSRYYAVGVADARIYGDAQKSTLVAVAKVLLDSTLTFATSATDIAGGKRNPLRYTYFHSARVTGKITSAEWNLSLIAKNNGGTLSNGAVVPITESITLVDKVGTVTETPVGSEGGTAYCWYVYNGTEYRATFSGKTFTVDSSIPDDSIVCASYSYTNSGVTKLTVPANYIPSILYIELDQDVATDNAGNGIVGRNLFVIPSAVLTGNQTINMTADGYSETALEFNAISYTPYGATCETGDVYCYMIQEIFDENWYDTAVDLAVYGVDTLVVAETGQLNVVQIKEGLGESWLVPDYADLTFDDGTPTYASVDANGVVTGVSAGTQVITVTVTAKPTLTASINVEVTAS